MKNQPAPRRVPMAVRASRRRQAVGTQGASAWASAAELGRDRVEFLRAYSSSSSYPRTQQ